MNVFFKIDGEIITPALNGSILPGITRDSIIELLKHWNLPVSERRISMEEVLEAYKSGNWKRPLEREQLRLYRQLVNFYGMVKK